MIRDLATLGWLHEGSSIILYGPVGVGKTHVAQSLGQLVIRAGFDLRFIKASRALAHLSGGHVDGSWKKRPAELARPTVLILDDWAMRELKAAQADDLYELVSERAVARKPLILTSNRAPKDWYPLFPNKVVGESLLDRLINNSYQVFLNVGVSPLGVLCCRDQLQCLFTALAGLVVVQTQPHGEANTCKQGAGSAFRRLIR